MFFSSRAPLSSATGSAAAAGGMHGRSMFSSARTAGPVSSAAPSTMSGAAVRGMSGPTPQSGLHIRVCIRFVVDDDDDSDGMCSLCTFCFLTLDVFCLFDRVRPENSQEVNSNKVVEIIDNQSLVFDPWHMTKDSRGHGSSLTTRRARNIVFGFDRVCVSFTQFFCSTATTA